MKKKFLGRVLTMLLVASMVFTLLPAPAIAAGNWWWNNDEYTEEAVPTATTDDYNRILHLDCGRKYFTKDWIIALLHEMKAAGYNQLELAFGNDGLRFLLKDMSFTANGTTYDHNTIVQKVEAGNKLQNSSGDARWLTQAEMDKIIETANGLGIEIVPLLNLPGHANAILDIADDTLNAFGSNNTLDVANSEAARNFGKAIFAKYLDYFYGKGCKFFNFGADEYANDASGTFSFSRLNSTQYQAFVSFINDLAGMIIKKGMTPRAFNDGLYYNRGEWDMNTSVNTNIPKIQCCYWSPGWDSYPVASADTIAQKGHGMINTHGDWYYVTKYDKYGYEVIQIPSDSAIEGFSNTSFAGGKINNPVGSMFCIWCDAPAIRTEQEIAGNIRLLLRKMAARMQDKSIETISTDVVPGGFNEDGSLTTTTPTPPDGGTTPPETITVPVNGTKEITVDGNVTVTTDGDYNASIATYESNQTTETTTTETPVTSPVGKSFYIRNVSGTTGTMYLGDGASWQADVSNAKKWICRDYSYFGSTYYYLELDGASQKTYLRYLDGGQWSVTTSSSNRTLFNFDSTSTTFKTADNWWGTSYTLGTPVEVKTDSTPKTTITFNGLTVGTTYVTIGNVKYTIKVVPEDVNNVEPLSIEYWITNGKVQRSESDATKSLAVSAKMNGIATPDGVEVTSATMIPQNGYRDGRTVDYWQCRLLDTSISNTYGDNTQKQTEQNGDDETTSGVAFTKVRYYEGHWAVYTEKNGWVNVESKHQLVAYYMEHIQVTDEVDSHAADWGNIGDGRTGGWIDYPYCTLSVQVVYEDGTKNPVNEAAENLKAKSIVYGYWADGRGIGTVLLSGNRDFEIVKVTAKKGTVNATISNKNSANITKFEWNKDETAVTVWEDEKGSMEASVHAPAKAFNKADKNNNLVWTSESQAILLRVYVRAKVTEDALTVNYYDESNLAKPFYNYNIAVANGTYFDSNIALNDPWKGNLKNGTVTNIKGVDQTVSADLYTMPAIGANYRYMEYNCTRVEPIKDENGHVKTVNLYYTFTDKVTFVADFGLPIRIPITEINDTLKNATINEVTVRGAEYGTVSADKSGITYTPTKAFGADAEALQVSVKGQITVQGESGSTEQKSEVAYQVYILPASNVLYEENFLTEAPASSGRNWTEVTPNKLGSQETQKVNGTGSYNVFGRDTAYDNVTGELGVWKASDLVAGQGATKDLSTEFYGNGFDLIGNCGPDTGRVFLFISGANQIKLVDVDTRYSGGTLNQVPLAHVMLEQEANYQVKVSAAGLNATDATSASYSLSGAATYASDYAVGGYDADLYNVLAENGLTMADVEYVKVESAPAATARSAASFYALDTAAVGGTVTHEAGTHVEIGGFRVYRSSANNTNYPKSEQDVRYLNILDAVDSFTAFVEGSAADSEWKARDKYESAGGPQNEIYLRETDGENSAIAFKIDPNAIVQISARAVENNKPATLVVNGVATVIETNTEMYYTFAASENGIVTIKNTGEGMLALGNLKIKKGTQVAALSEEDYPAAIALLSLNAAPETPDEGFDPAISAKVTTTRFIRSKVVTLTVSASSDVAVLEVNGVELRPTNSWLVKMGWSDTYTYILTEKVQKNEIKTYEIVGYRADGAASETIVVKSK